MHSFTYRLVQGCALSRFVPIFKNKFDSDFDQPTTMYGIDVICPGKMHYVIPRGPTGIRTQDLLFTRQAL